MEQSVNTDNQQQTVSDLDIGWLVGVIEGEGSISLLISKRANRMQALRVEPRVIITNTDPAIIEKCLSILAKLGVGRWVKHTRPNNEKYGQLVNKSYKDITYIHITGYKRVMKLIPIMEKVMAGDKKKRCSILGRFI